MTQEPLRVGVVGVGFIGGVHARSVWRNRARLVGVAASSASTAEQAAARLGAERAYDTALDLVTSPEVEVAHICTPNHLHLPLTMAALDAGKHVVCEKPIGLDGDQAAALTRAVADAGTVATVPFVYRFYPMVREARARAAGSEVGPIRLIHGGYLQDWLLSSSDTNWRVDASMGGASRAFADIGSHWCDLVEFVSGQRITRLSARVTSSVGNNSTEDAATVLFETNAGALGTMLVSQISPGRKNRLFFELAGEHATLRFDQEHPESLWVGRRSGVTTLTGDAQHLDPAAARFVTLPPGHPQGYQDCFDLFVADTYALIRGEAVDGVPGFEDGLRTARLTDAVMLSARTQTWAEVVS